MSGWLIVIAVGAAVVAFTGIAHMAATHAWIRLMLRRRMEWRRTDPMPPVTFLRPIKAGVPALRDKLERLGEAMRDGDQLVIGVERGSDEERIAENVVAKLREVFPGREFVVVGCERREVHNPKIAKLLQMDRASKHSHLILSDAETLLDLECVESIRKEWSTEGKAVLTCPYRFVGFDTWPQQMDAVPVLATFLPGVLTVRELGTVRFTLGACTALLREDLEKVGGWKAFGEELAEDHALGKALAAAGCEIGVSATFVPISSDPMTWRDWWRHQRRVAVTYRVVNPAGFAGLILVHAETAGLILVAIGMWWLMSRADFGRMAISLGVLTWMVRYGLCHDGGALIRFRVPWMWVLFVPSGWMETVFWLLAWIRRRVWWGGRWWRVSKDGRLEAW